MRPRRGASGRLTQVMTISILALHSLMPAMGQGEYSIRDAGFIVREPQSYRLYVFVSDDTPDLRELAGWLMAAAGPLLAESNIRTEIINVDRQDSHPAMVYYRRMRPTQLPAAILASPRDAAIIVAGFGPEDLSEDAVWDLVAGVASSPKREELLRHLIIDWCVLVVVEGDDRSDNQRAQSAAEDAARDLVGTVTDTGETILRRPHVMTVSWRDPRERILLWSLGMDERHIGDAGVAVVFGMGRRLGRLVTGDDVDEDVVMGLLELLGRDSSWTTDPRSLLGPEAPLVWGRDRAEQVRDELGFDPNDPDAARALSRVWPSLGAEYFAGSEARELGGGYVGPSLQDPDLAGLDEIESNYTPAPPPVVFRPSASDETPSAAAPAQLAQPAQPEAIRTPLSTRSDPAEPADPPDPSPATAGGINADGAVEALMADLRDTEPSPESLAEEIAPRVASARASFERRTNLTLLIFVGVLGLVAGAGGAFIVLSRNQRS